MFTYKNKVTGAVIHTHGKVSGEDWAEVTKVKDPPAGEKTEQTADGNMGSDGDDNKKKTAAGKNGKKEKASK